MSKFVRFHVHNYASFICRGLRSLAARMSMRSYVCLDFYVFQNMSFHIIQLMNTAVCQVGKAGIFGHNII